MELRKWPGSVRQALLRSPPGVRVVDRGSLLRHEASQAHARVALAVGGWWACARHSGGKGSSCRGTGEGPGNSGMRIIM